MIFGAVPLARAEGALLAHALRLPGGNLPKGMTLTPEALARIAAAGLHDVTVARLEPGDVEENEAALALARALVPDPDAAGLVISRPGTGRVNLFAAGPGIAQVAPAKVHAVNAVDPMITLATVPEWQRMARRGMVATVKIISYAVPGTQLEAACAVAGGALRLRGAQLRRVALIETRSDGPGLPMGGAAGTGKGVGVGAGVDAEDRAGAAEPAEDSKGRRAVARRLTRLGARLEDWRSVPHRPEPLAAALRGLPQAEALLILTASATSDVNDVAPAALRAAGGEVTRFGMPVDPGNLLFLGRLDGRPVIGLPGCARAPALNGADWVLERLLCGVPVGGPDIAAMGVGGLLKEIPTRPQPRDPS